jgi:cell wall assembly regulator SMI1
VTVDELERTLRARDDVLIGTGAAEADIDSAERSLGVRFPDAFREYLRRFGHLELGHFELYGLGSDLPKYLQLVAMTVTERTESGCPLPHELVPLLNDGAGNLYCVDTRRPAAGRVVLWDHTLGRDQEPDQQSGSLPDWIGQLLAELDES